MTTKKKNLGPIVGTWKATHKKTNSSIKVFNSTELEAIQELSKILKLKNYLLKEFKTELIF
jgi:hypothetical protein